MVTHATRREATPFYLQVYEVSQQRACQVIGADRSSVRYRSRRPEDGLLRLRLREIALRRRFGYHRLHILREGIAVNRKKLRRLFGHCVQSEARRTAPLQHRTGQPQTVTRPSHHRMSSSPRSTHSLCPKPLKQRNPNSHHSALDNSSASSSHRGSTQACFYTIRHSSAIASKSNKIISRDAILTRYWTTH